MLRNYITKPIAALSLLALVILPFSGCGYAEREQARQEKKAEINDLVDRCNGKAAGEDGILSPEDQVAFARDFGYKGAILSGETVLIYRKSEIVDNSEATLYIGKGIEVPAKILFF